MTTPETQRGWVLERGAFGSLMTYQIEGNFHVPGIKVDKGINMHHAGTKGEAANGTVEGLRLRYSFMNSCVGELQVRVAEAKLKNWLFLCFFHPAGGGVLQGGMVYVRSGHLFMTSGRVWPLGDILPWEHIVIFRTKCLKPRDFFKGWVLRKYSRKKGCSCCALFIAGRWAQNLGNQRLVVVNNNTRVRALLCHQNILSSVVLKTNELSGSVWFCKHALLPPASPKILTQTQTEMLLGMSYFRLQISFSTPLSAAATLIACSMQDSSSRPEPQRQLGGEQNLSWNIAGLGASKHHLILLISALTARKTRLATSNSLSLPLTRSPSLGCTKTLNKDIRDRLQALSSGFLPLPGLYKTTKGKYLVLTTSHSETSKNPYLSKVIIKKSGPTNTASLYKIFPSSAEWSKKKLIHFSKPELRHDGNLSCSLNSDEASPWSMKDPGSYTVMWWLQPP